MDPSKVLSFEESPRDHGLVAFRGLLTPFRMLLSAWVGLGLLPFILQIRSYLKFATPHKVAENLVVPANTVKEVANLTALCPAQGFLMAGVWWNVAPTHYYNVGDGRICHVVVPQYNLHGQYRVGKSLVTPFHSTPPECSEDSYFFEQYLYHGSFGYYAFYEEAEGSFCARDNTAYALVQGLGTYDINGWFLAQDAGGDGYRFSYWYGVVGSIWLAYRFLVLRRGYIALKRYGRRCAQMNEGLLRKPAMVFVHENLRLSAHGARNLQRIVLLYLVVEGLMSDLFLLIANDAVFAKVQYISLGYNLSGLLLLVWEIVESMNWFGEQWRVFFKRLLFSYESSLLGEFLSATVQQLILVSLNRSGLKKSQPEALAVSYYVWSFLWHTVYVLCLIMFILSVRTTWALSYVLWRMTMLGSYRYVNKKLYYRPDALKAFGLLKMVEGDRTEFLVQSKLHWIAVPRDNLIVIGSVSRRFVQHCTERTCTGIISFFDRSLGGDRRNIFGRKAAVAPGPSTMNVLPPSGVVKNTAPKPKAWEHVA